MKNIMNKLKDNWHYLVIILLAVLLLFFIFENQSIEMQYQTKIKSFEDRQTNLENQISTSFLWEWAMNK